MLRTQRSRQLEERGGVWSVVPHSREARTVPDLELTRSCQPGCPRAQGLVLSLGMDEPKEASVSSVWLQNSRFVSSLGDSCSTPSSFKCGKDLLPKHFTAISKAHTPRCCLFITRNSSITKLDKEEWQLHIVFDVV